MNENLKKKISELFGKIDTKVLETKLNQAMEMIKDGKHEEIVEKLNKMDKKEIFTKLEELKNLPPESIAAIKDKINLKIDNEDISKLENKLDPEGKKIIKKMISTFNDT